MAWHTHQQRLAVSDASDSVQLYNLASSARPAFHADDLHSPDPGATLFHEDQRRVTAMEFRPHGSGMLAVAGRGGVTLWDLEAPTSRSAKYG
jgi:hypothetical protein